MPRNDPNCLEFHIEALESRVVLNGTSILPNGDFEPASMEPWFSWGGTLSVSKANYHEGAQSAFITDRTDASHGIAQDVSALLQEDVAYEASVWVRVENAAGHTIELGIKQRDKSGTQYFPLDSRSEIPANGWIPLGGAFSLHVDGNLELLELYVIGPAAGISFFVDDVRLRDMSFRTNDSVAENGGFENGVSNWYATGGTLSIDSRVTYDGDQAGFLTSRTEYWHGVSQDLSGTLTAGFEYDVRAKVRVENATGQQVQLGIKQVDNAGTQYFPLDEQASVVANEWMTLGGEFQLELTGTLSLLEFYILGPTPGVNFHVDDVSVTPSSVVANSRFDSSASWFTYGGDLVVQSGITHGGVSAALVENRFADYNGVAQNLTTVLQRDQDYNVSAWVYVPESGNHRVELGMKQIDDRGERFVTVDLKTDVPGNQWVRLNGGFRAAVTGDLQLLEVYVLGPEAGVDLYVDDVVAAPHDWRTESDALIDHLRKRSVDLHFIGKKGKPVADVTWSVEQIGHDFAFGSTLSEDVLSNAQYRQFFLDNFNWATVETTLQWRAIEWTQDVEDYSIADQIIAFTNANNIPTRGHAVFWGEDIRLPSWVDGLTDAELQAELVERVNSVVSRYAGQLAHWDVNNEMLQNSYFADRLGDSIRSWMFSATEANDPNAQLFTNEYNVLAWINTDAYVTLIQELLNDGAALDVIGVQSHMDPTILENPSPASIHAKLNELDDFGLPIWITEFDSKNPDDFERAKDLDTFYRAAYSHPAIEGIMMWGFWEGAHWRGADGALVDLDWTVNPAGQAYLDLRNEWTTFASGQTASKSTASFRGFHGTYRLTATLPDGSSITRTVQLSDDVGVLDQNISLTELPGVAQSKRKIKINSEASGLVTIDMIGRTVSTSDGTLTFGTNLRKIGAVGRVGDGDSIRVIGAELGEVITFNPGKLTIKTDVLKLTARRYENVQVDGYGGGSLVRLTAVSGSTALVSARSAALSVGGRGVEQFDFPTIDIGSVIGETKEVIHYDAQAVDQSVPDSDSIVLRGVEDRELILGIGEL